MDQKTRENPNVIRDNSLKALLARSLLDNSHLRRKFERIMRDMNTTSSIIIFDSDCSIHSPYMCTRGKDPLDSFVLRPVSGRIFVPLYPRIYNGFSFPIVFFSKDGSTGMRFVINNFNNFSEIGNMGEILIGIMNIMQEAYALNIPIDPFHSFMLELPQDASVGYLDHAKIAMRMPDLKIEDLGKRMADSQNIFIDHFMRQNFRNAIKSSPELENRLINYHIRMITDRKRRLLDSESGHANDIYQFPL